LREAGKRYTRIKQLQGGESSSLPQERGREKKESAIQMGKGPPKY